MPIMIWIAIVIMLALEHWIDFAILMAIQLINAFLGWYETVKAADAVAALKASLKPLATVKRDGSWQNIDAVNLVPGDLVLLAAGSSVPADCLVNHGALVGVVAGWGALAVGAVALSDCARNTLRHH